ncbi:MAG TPA: hypothetical protein VFG89_03890 [Coriobacteriia bacterium]|nr:hypothetical protein [Coriobacteriia bacterium]
MAVGSEGVLVGGSNGRLEMLSSAGRSVWVVENPGRSVVFIRTTESMDCSVVALVPADGSTLAPRVLVLGSDGRRLWYADAGGPKRNVDAYVSQDASRVLLVQDAEKDGQVTVSLRDGANGRELWHDSISDAAAWKVAASSSLQRIAVGAVVVSRDGLPPSGELRTYSLEGLVDELPLESPSFPALINSTSIVLAALDGRLEECAWSGGPIGPAMSLCSATYPSAVDARAGYIMVTSYARTVEETATSEMTRVSVFDPARKLVLSKERSSAVAFTTSLAADGSAVVMVPDSAGAGRGVVIPVGTGREYPLPSGVTAAEAIGGAAIVMGASDGSVSTGHYSQ